ncbi:MAG: tRNA (adenosine(37)-N6)-threonylcarbamoyltransferase complex dimerization subunit type 1 TsaB [Verrucomicrobia bacterium]|nr:tRNA (adenosine(37)-N6)-threonylcarbamoyltransferase complex dimerization subunit type 1 TsaB [Verrucomicrobiota bacterium]
MPGTFTLILETSSPHASLAIAGADGSLIGREFSSARSHHARLFGPLAELLETLPAAGLGRVLVGSGPGSYSGTRVGIAAAQGVAIANACEAVALPSLLALPTAAASVACLAIGDARRGGFWLARVAARRMMAEPELTDGAGLIAAVAAAVTQGIPVIAIEEPTRFPLPGELAPQVRQEFPSATGLWLAWCLADAATRAAWASAAPQPIYLKPPHVTAAKRPWLVPS